MGERSRQASRHLPCTLGVLMWQEICRSADSLGPSEALPGQLLTSQVTVAGTNIPYHPEAPQGASQGTEHVTSQALYRHCSWDDDCAHPRMTLLHSVETAAPPPPQEEPLSPLHCVRWEEDPAQGWGRKQGRRMSPDRLGQAPQSGSGGLQLTPPQNTPWFR